MMKVGQRVRNTRVERWGLGEVIDASGSNPRVFFENHGEVTISPIVLAVVEGPEAQSMRLDEALGQRSTRPAAKKRAPRAASAKAQKAPKEAKPVRAPIVSRLPVNLAEAKASFQQIFARAFEDSRYKITERDPKRNASRQFRMNFTPAFFASSQGRNAVEVGHMLRKGIATDGSHLIATPLANNLATAIMDPTSASVLYETLRNSVGTGATLSDAELFQAWNTAFEQIGITDWTLATYFGFLLRPDSFLVMQPLSARFMADVIKFDLHYDATPNATTFEHLQAMGNHLLRELADLGASDMIDVQSFLAGVYHRHNE
jgi:Protein of unknown function (DUF3553)